MVSYARELFEKGYRKKQIQPRAFERVYAVFDRDDHLTYHDALQLANSLDNKLRNNAKQAVIFKAIASVPSFELWLLLHFEDIQAPLHQDEVLQRLKQHIPGYQKGEKGAFAVTRDRLRRSNATSQTFGGAVHPIAPLSPYRNCRPRKTLDHAGYVIRYRHAGASKSRWGSGAPIREVRYLRPAG